MPSALPCDVQLSALALCERRHPREKDLVCKVRRDDDEKISRRRRHSLRLDLELIKNLSTSTEKKKKKKKKKKKALNAAAAWCLLKLRCPLEAADLEGCCGVSKSSGRSRIQGPPTSVPKECQGAAARLEACLERASEEESEERRG